MQFTDEQSVGDIREYLRKEWKNGVDCPACHQHVKLYRRNITSSMAWALLLVYKEFKKHPTTDALHVGNFLNSQDIPGAVRNTGDFAKLRFWGLIDPVEGRREDGSKRNGYYRITDIGRIFCENKIEVAKYKFIYNNHAHDESDDTISIEQCLKDNQFNYQSIMQV